MWVSGNAGTGQCVNSTNVNRNCRRLCLVTCPPCWNLLHVLHKNQTAVRRRSSVPDVGKGSWTEFRSHTEDREDRLAGTLVGCRPHCAPGITQPAGGLKEKRESLTDSSKHRESVCSPASSMPHAPMVASHCRLHHHGLSCRGRLKNPLHVNRLVILPVESDDLENPLHFYQLVTVPSAFLGPPFLLQIVYGSVLGRAH